MRRRAAAALRFVTAVVVASPQIARAQTVSPDAFRHRLTSIYDEIARSDTVALGPTLANGLVWIGGASGAALTKAQLMAAAALPQTPTPRFDVDSVRATRIGSTVVVDYVRTDHRFVGTTDLSAHWRAVAVFVGRGGDWRLARHTLSWVARPVHPITLDSATLWAFAGRYQIAPDYVDNVHWESGVLVATVSGQSAGARLVPVSSSAFSPDGVGALIVFERDTTGRVVDYVQGYPDGVVRRAMKLP